MTDIAENTFAEACYNENSIKDLETALAGDPDKLDMAEWNLTAYEWRDQIKMAISALREDAQ